MSSISVPQLLLDGTALELNNEIFKQTNAFPFINPDEKLMLAFPKSNAEAFVCIVIGLYKLYHDFGVNRLKLFEDNSLRHVQNVEKLRTFVAHGQIISLKNNHFVRILKSYMDVAVDDGWPGFIDNMDDAYSWKSVVNNLTKEADKLYDTFLSYAKGEKSIDKVDFQLHLEKALDMKRYKEIYSETVHRKYHGNYQKVESIINTDSKIQTFSYENGDVISKWIEIHKADWTHNIINKKMQFWTKPKDLIPNAVDEVYETIEKLVPQKFNIGNYI